VTTDAQNPTSGTEPVAPAAVTDAVVEGIAAAYDQAAGAPVEVALDAVLEQEEARGVELNEEFALPFAEAISRGEDPLGK
jgi:hypothetical protein